MKNIRIFLPENFHVLVVKFSVYLNRHVFVMYSLSAEQICSRRHSKFSLFFFRENKT